MVHVPRRTATHPRIGVLGAGFAGSLTALKLAKLGHDVMLIDKASYPMAGASLHNEGKLHLGYVYAATSDDRTHQLVAEGSRSFLPIVEELTGISQDRVRRSDPFVYIVPVDSQRPADQIADHFMAVDRLVSDQQDDHCPSERLDRGDWPACYADDTQAVFQTCEVAVDTHQLSAIIGAAVLAHERIEFVGDTDIVGAATVDRSRLRSPGAFSVRVTAAGSRPNAEERRSHGNGGEESLSFDSVVNALWQGRVRLDADLGLTDDTPWLWRWKAAIDIGGTIVDGLPSTTAVLGPYGDVVNYDGARTYVSWYPACSVGLTDEVGFEPLSDRIDRIDRDLMLKKSFAGIAGLIPQVGRMDGLERRARIGGGYIMAVGNTDIDDPKSGLHDRADIGVNATDGWISIETGKYCTAPMFALDAASKVNAHLEGT